MVITVSWPTIAGERRARLTAPFCIGGDASGELQIDEQKVTRANAAVFLRDGQWCVRDLGCPNGLLINGTRVDNGVLPRRAALALGSSGLEVTLEVGDPDRWGAKSRLPNLPAAGRRTAPRFTRFGAPSPRPPSSADIPPIAVRVGTEPAPRDYRDRARIGAIPAATSASTTTGSVERTQKFSRSAAVVRARLAAVTGPTSTAGVSRRPCCRRAARCVSAPTGRPSR